ncbi:MAG: phosphatidate cytidylyltransferase [Alphaproteobacteria bacterium]|nr:phosphatidate cytidylyltransferase [Alphaproteobacteria bacterium]
MPAAAAVIFMGGVTLALAVMIVVFLMAWEWGALVATSPATLTRARVLLSALGLATLATTVLFTASHGVFAAIGAYVVTMALGRVMGMRSGLWAAAAVLSITIPAIAVLWMRELPSLGLETVVWAIATVVAVDVGAYAAGRTIGGPRLWPRVSPSKTWAGLAGGAVAAVVVAGITTAVIGDARLLVLVPVAIVLALTAQVGDLLESSVKRRFEVKDSGVLIPGHGGVLDRVDGQLTVLPLVAAAVWISGRSVLAW